MSILYRSQPHANTADVFALLRLVPVVLYPSQVFAEEPFESKAKNVLRLVRWKIADLFGCQVDFYAAIGDPSNVLCRDHHIFRWQSVTDRDAVKYVLLV